MSSTAATHTPEQIDAMLAAAAAGSTNTTRAALHLLRFADLTATAVLPRHLEFEDVDAGDTTVPGAWVRDWAALRQDLGRHLHGGLECLLTVAESLDKGEPVDLRLWMPRTGGHAYARALIEAMAIATGYDEWYSVTPGPKLAEHEQARAQLLGE